jgi:hypothetical protein
MAIFNDELYECKHLYTDGSTTIMPIRVKPAVVAATIAGTANTSPTTPVNTNASAYARGSRKRYGVHARNVSLVRVVGSGATAFRVHEKLPILTTAVEALAQVGAEVIYNGFTWEIVDTQEEQVV